MTRPPIFLTSLGCPRNLVDSEVLIGLLRQKGFRVIYEMKKHSIAIVNTCGFIEDAKSESIDVVLQLAALRKKGELEKLILTGCLSQRYSEELMKDIGEIDAIFGSSNFAAIPQQIDRIRAGEKIIAIDKVPRFLYNHRTPRALITPRHSVYVKIQEGCRNCCSYCVIPKVRGPFRSRSIESVLKEITLLKDSGAKEINLIGQDTTLYGIDRYGTFKLPKLIKKASKIMKSRWIRLLYTHPAHYTQELIDVVRGEASVCKYLDLPIQHISDKILRKMHRLVTKRDIIRLITKLRKEIPGLAIRTSVIVGFPGETERDFRELEEFIGESGFDRLGAFLYSREEGTRAYDFKDQLPREEKEKRLSRLMELQKGISEKNNERYIGKHLKVLIDETGKSASQSFVGRTEHDAPEVDGTVYVKSGKPLKKGDFVNVKIEDTLEYDLVGKV